MLLRNTVSYAVVLKALKIIPLTICLLAVSGYAVAGNAVRAGFDTKFLATDVSHPDDPVPVWRGSDDKSSGLENIGFPVNFYGKTYADGLYVNNNGNVTFGQEFTDHNGEVLLNTQRVIIAPFLADVDTRAGNVVTYGEGVVDGRVAYGVNWGDVGCYSRNVSVLNNFQVLLIDRSNIDTGDFDIEFNYNQIQWDTGPSEGGQIESCTNSKLTDRTSARIGFSNGNSVPGQEAKAYELTGSGVPNYFLDTNLDTGLVHGSRNSDVPGRYLFSVRNGVVIVNDGPVANAGPDQTVEFVSNGVQVALDGTASSTDPADDPLSYNWSGSFLGGTATGPNPVVYFESLGSHTVTLTVTDAQSATNDDTVIVNAVDTTVPVLSLPTDISIECAGAGLLISDPRIQMFLKSATASDTVDPNPTVTNNAPEFCELGDTVVTFTATDVSGNSSEGTAIISLVDGGKPVIEAALVPVGQKECEEDDDDDDEDDDDDYKSDSRRGSYTSHQRSSKHQSYGKYKRGKKNAKRNRNNKDDDDDDCDDDDDDKRSYRQSSKHGNDDDDDDDCDDEEGLFRVEFSCTDSCSATGSGTALLNGIPVKNGQIVELERDDDNEAEYDDGILSIEAPSFRLEVTCGDTSGNMSKLVVRPQFQCRDDD